MVLERQYEGFVEPEFISAPLCSCGIEVKEEEKSEPKNAAASSSNFWYHKESYQDNKTIFYQTIIYHVLMSGADHTCQAFYMPLKHKPRQHLFACQTQQLQPQDLHHLDHQLAGWKKKLRHLKFRVKYKIAQ